MASGVLTMMLAAGVRAVTHRPVSSTAWRSASVMLAPSRVSASRLRGGIVSMSSAASTRDLVSTALAVPSADVHFSTAPTSASEWTGDLLVALVSQSESDEAVHAELSSELNALDAMLDGTLAAVIADSGFKGKPGDSKVITLPPKYGVKRVALVGVGKKPAADAPVSAALGAGLKWGAAVAAMAKAEKATTASVALAAGTSAAEIQAAMEALYVGVCSDERFKDMHPEALKTAEERALKLKSVQLLGAPSDGEAALAKALGMAKAVVLCKAMVNAPANYLTPTMMALTAQRIAKENGLAIEV
ncbi:hypothetical protein T492DRAFT_157298, partial [Pavlovales sp. CCMP2436]